MKHPCFGKATYNNLNKVRRKILSNYFTDKNAWNYYTCPICLDFHLTSHGPKPRFDSRAIQRYFGLTLTQNLIEKRTKLMHGRKPKLTKRERKRRRNIISREEYQQAMYRMKHPLLSQLSPHL